MGATLELVNVTKKERIMFMRLPVSKEREISGNHVSATITTWYLIRNRGDTIGFVSDYDEKWPLKEGGWDELQSYREVTDKVIESLIEAKLIKDNGITLIDDDPELEERNLKVIW